MCDTREVYQRIICLCSFLGYSVSKYNSTKSTCALT